MYRDHAHGFESWSFSSGAQLDDTRVRALLDAFPGEILRAKGILWLSSDPAHRTIYQRVGPRWSFAWDRNWNGETPVSRLVLIGPRGAIDLSEMALRFDACRMG